jgi:hypothetical protein
MMDLLRSGRAAKEASDQCKALQTAEARANGSAWRGWVNSGGLLMGQGFAFRMSAHSEGWSPWRYAKG